MDSSSNVATTFPEFDDSDDWMVLEECGCNNISSDKDDMTSDNVNHDDSGGGILCNTYTSDEVTFTDDGTGCKPTCKDNNGGNVHHGEQTDGGKITPENSYEDGLVRNTTNWRDGVQRNFQNGDINGERNDSCDGGNVNNEEDSFATTTVTTTTATLINNNNNNNNNCVNSTNSHSNCNNIDVSDQKLKELTEFLPAHTNSNNIEIPNNTSNTNNNIENVCNNNNDNISDNNIKTNNGNSNSINNTKSNDGFNNNRDKFNDGEMITDEGEPSSDPPNNFGIGTQSRESIEQPSESNHSQIYISDSNINNSIATGLNRPSNSNDKKSISDNHSLLIEDSYCSNVSLESPVSPLESSVELSEVSGKPSKENAEDVCDAVVEMTSVIYNVNEVSAFETESDSNSKNVFSDKTHPIEMSGEAENNGNSQPKNDCKSLLMDDELGKNWICNQTEESTLKPADSNHNTTNNIPEVISLDNQLIAPPTIPVATVLDSKKNLTIKKRLDLENILQRKLLLAAKPVNHSMLANNEPREVETSDNSSQSKAPSPLRLNGSVQVLTDHPRSIAVLSPTPNSTGKTIKEILQLNSTSTERQMTDVTTTNKFNETETNSKRANKRKCSSPHRIVKKNDSTVYARQNSDEPRVVSLNTPRTSVAPPSLARPNPSSSVALPGLTFNFQAVSSTSLEGFSYSSILPANVITIVPDEVSNEPPPLPHPRAKPSASSLKTLRLLAPKSSRSTTLSTSTAPVMVTRASITPNVIPISLVQSTTTPSFVILVNKNASDGTQFLSAQPLQLHQQHQRPQQQLLQQQQIRLQQVPQEQQFQLSSSQSLSNLIIRSPITIEPLPRLGVNPPKPLQPKSSAPFSSAVPSTTIVPNTPPKLKLILQMENQKDNQANKNEDGLVAFIRRPLESSTNRNPSSLPKVADVSLENFFESCRNNCVTGKYVAPLQKTSKLHLAGSGSSSSFRYACGSCGCTFSSEAALKEHCERKSFLVTFECSCYESNSKPPSTFYNLCAFSIFYHRHVLQHPYIAHSPAINYKISLLPEDQLPDVYHQLAETRKSFPVGNSEMASSITMANDANDVTPSESKGETSRFSCKECNKKFRQPQRLKQHFQTWNRNEITARPSGSGCKAAATSATVTATTSAAAAAVDVDTIIAPPHLASTYHECPTCGIVLPNVCSLKAHKRMHDCKKPLVCPECGLSFSTTDIFMEHVDKVCFHECRRALVKGCRFCNFIPPDSTTFAQALDEHIISVHKRCYIKCSSCPVAFKDDKFFQKHHLADHAGQAIRGVLVSRCPVCESVLTSPFDKHLANHDVDNKSRTYFFRCLECGEGFVYRAELEKHLRDSSHGQSEMSGYVCKLCMLTFESRLMRQEHIITEHNDLKEMFSDELSGFDDSSSLRLSNKDANDGDLVDLSHPSVLRISKPLPPLRPIATAGIASQPLTSLNSLDSNVTGSASGQNNHSSSLDLGHSGSSSASKKHKRMNSGDGNSVVTVQQPSSTLSSLLTAPERWECSRCNEVFVNSAAFIRHQQKHRFLEQSKSKRRKLSAAAAATAATTAAVEVSAPSSLHLIGNCYTNTQATNVTTPTLTGSLTISSTSSMVSSVTETTTTSEVTTTTTTTAAISTPAAAASDNFMDVNVRIKDEGKDGSCGGLKPTPSSGKRITSNYELLPRLLEQPRAQFQQLQLPRGESQDFSADTQYGWTSRWHSCQLCSMSFKSSELLQLHVESRHVGKQPVKPTVFSCSYCSPSSGQSKRSFTLIRHLHKHLRLRHKIIRSKAGLYVSLDAPYRPDGRQEAPPQPPLVAVVPREDMGLSDLKSNFELLPPSSPSEGLASPSGGDSCCFEADEEMTKDPENAKTRKIFGNGNVYVCSYCDHSNSDRSEFWEHIVDHDKEFIRDSRLSNRSVSQCPECGSLFVVKPSLFRHLKAVHRVFEEYDYETELEQFQAFKKQVGEQRLARHKNGSKLQDLPRIVPTDLPADKLAKLASLRPEDIHAGIHGTSRSACVFEFQEEHASSSTITPAGKRPGLRSQPKLATPQGTTGNTTLAPGSVQSLSSDSHDSSPASNECKVCYKTFESQVDLRVHMRVHGMAFIQGTRRSSTTNRSAAGGPSSSNEKTVAT